MSKRQYIADTHRMKRIKRIHFVGIGGSGMGGIAEVFLNLGFEVSGSDIKENATTGRLLDLGADIGIGHAVDNVRNVDVVVKSSAVDDSNVEVGLAKSQKIPVIPRAEMLAELMRFRFGIGVAGTHGKTTTTSLVASVLAEAGLDPTFVIGGCLNSIGTNARLGQGDYLVAEADESDASFLYLQPMIAILTNIDRDHMETYSGSYQKLKDAFIEFIHHVPFYGLAIVCIDDVGVSDILPAISKPIVTYGTREGADVRADNIRQEGLKSTFNVHRAEKPGNLSIELNMPGRHNLLNALAAIAVATELGVSDQVICKSLAEFKGVGRRFEFNARIDVAGGDVLLFDDYGHHPREIAATLESARIAWPKRRLVLVFQPHRYTRTKDLFEDFVRVLSSVDVLVLLDVYTAGEKHITGADGRSLSHAIRVRGQIDPIFVEDAVDLAGILAGLMKANDIVMTMGAGSVGRISTELPNQLEAELVRSTSQ